MTEKELKRLSRSELLDELSKYSNANADLQLRLENLQEEIRRMKNGYELKLSDAELRYQQGEKNLQEAQAEISNLKGKMRRQSADMREAGNIAEATLKITGFFEQTQKTAEAYLENVRIMAEKQQQELAELDKKSREDIQLLGDEATKTCHAMKSETEKECAALRAKTEEDCERLKKESYLQAEAYWENLTKKLEDFYNAHMGMRELFAGSGIRIPDFQEIRKPE